MSRVAVLKPDHLGDLVLASPAIRAIHRHFADVTLFVSSYAAGLARFLFPDITDVRTVDFPHLARRSAGEIAHEDLCKDLDGFEMVFCLRDDPVLRSLIERLAVRCVLAVGEDLAHDSALHKRAVSPVVGNYSRTALFAGRPILWPAAISHVGLCIAAGFPTNRWANSRWLETATALARQGMQISLIGGPGEAKDLVFLSRSMRHLPHRIIHGGSDVGAFLDALHLVDIVVASDGGTAHLCSLRKPMFSIFGSSPWRRYAPFGADNVLITRDMPCSPCVQFSSTELNGCMTRECMAAITARHVGRVLESNGLDFSLVRGVRVERGVSHRYET
jgi:ADP-heptose:LPS heptosyltransferase